MFLEIQNFLTPAEVQEIAAVARGAKFIDGRLSNPHADKKNVVADLADAPVQKVAQTVSAALLRNEDAKNFTFIRRFATPRLTRYGEGMRYGAHCDAAFMPLGQDPLRSDLSCTIFISDPGTYQGGELVIYNGSQDVTFKGKPGGAVFYPSTFIHQVMPVTSGERVVMLTFIESQIPDQAHRDIIYNINEVYALEGLKMDWRNGTRLQHVAANLLRMWSR